MDLKFQFQLQQELLEVQQELPQTNFLCPAQKALCQVVEVVVVVVEEEHQHLLLTSLAVLDVLVLYHEDHCRFRVFLRVTLKKMHLALKMLITACCMNYCVPHLLKTESKPNCLQWLPNPWT